MHVFCFKSFISYLSNNLFILHSPTLAVHTECIVFQSALQHTEDLLHAVTIPVDIQRLLRTHLFRRYDHKESQTVSLFLDHIFVPFIRDQISVVIIFQTEFLRKGSHILTTTDFFRHPLFQQFFLFQQRIQILVLFFTRTDIVIIDMEIPYRHIISEFSCPGQSINVMIRQIILRFCRQWQYRFFQIFLQHLAACFHHQQKVISFLIKVPDILCTEITAVQDQSGILISVFLCAINHIGALRIINDASRIHLVKQRRSAFLIHCTADVFSFL